MNIRHSTHCRGYRGLNAPYDDMDCDCGATILYYKTKLLKFLNGVDHVTANPESAGSYTVSEEGWTMISTQVYWKMLKELEQLRAKGHGYDKDRHTDDL